MRRRPSPAQRSSCKCNIFAKVKSLFIFRLACRFRLWSQLAAPGLVSNPRLKPEVRNSLPGPARRLIFRMTHRSKAALRKRSALGAMQIMYYRPAHHSKDAQALLTGRTLPQIGRVARKR
ncbi:hypothetical protein NDU88_005301 [Pleurodeles waltl]|uniref:Uncharacterized protein n=1 Tax=Pleurodeles waltl TaxID=8319 RepID=A0AAV7PIG7_PLEWA|nr:hypothetical protein NDU88_005301 [Pleurodeles waltl]